MSSAAALLASTKTFGALPGVNLAVVGPRLLLQIKDQSWVKVRPEGTGYLVMARTELGFYSTHGVDVRRMASEDGEWTVWRAFSDDALQSFLAVVYPHFRQQAFRASTSQRLRALLDGTTHSEVADVTQWEFWHGLAAFLGDSSLDRLEMRESAKVAKRLATLIAKGGRVYESDLDAGSLIAEAALRRGYQPPLVESGQTAVAPDVVYFDTVEVENPKAVTPSGVDAGARQAPRTCIHGYPAGICRSCGKPRTGRRRGL